MCEINIEHAGVHLATHALMDAERELQRELARGATSVAPTGKPDLTGVSREAALRRSNGGESSASDSVVRADAQTAPVPKAPAKSRADEATDRLRCPGTQALGDYTIRQLNAPPPPPFAVLRGTTGAVAVNGMTVTAWNGWKDVRKMLCASEEDHLAVAQAPEELELDEDESAATEFVKRFPRYRNDFVKILRQLREHRHQRESLESLEDITRNALADAWSLQWEDLYEFYRAAHRRAAEDMRARLSKAHWQERLQARQRERSCPDVDRDGESVFHTGQILADLDWECYLAWWNEQLASFHPSVLRLTGPEGEPQLSLESKSTAPAPE